MSRPDDKRALREQKRAVKKAGNRHRRRQAAQNLAANPEEAAHAEEDVGRHASAKLNGIDRDATRRRDGDAPTE